MLTILWAIVAIFIFKYTRKKFIFPAKTKTEWCVVTGCTDGIGLEFVRKFRTLGYNLILISKDLTKLESLEQELNDIEKKIIDVDFTYPKNFFLRYINATRDLNIKYVVNNVGISYFRPEYFHQLNNLDDIIACNVLNTSKLIYTTLRFHKPTFINMGSMLGDLPSPFYSVYSASKKYISNLTKNISLEYPDIKFVCLKPCVVSTKMTRVKSSFFVPSPKVYTNHIFNYGFYWPFEIVRLLCFIPLVKFILKFLLPLVIKKIMEHNKNNNKNN